MKLRQAHSLSLAALIALCLAYPLHTFAKPSATNKTMPANYIAGELFQLSGGKNFPNGAWCWFQDPRAIVDTQHKDGPILLVSSFSARERAEYTNRIWGSSQTDWAKGDNDLYWMNITKGTKGQVKIHQGLTQDDHNVAAITHLPDGRYLLAYADHGYERTTYFRTSQHPHDPTSWGKINTFTHTDTVTYSNLYTVPAQSALGNEKIINFNRSVGYNPNIMASMDTGKTWHYQGTLLGGIGRPYVRYAQGKDRVHFIASDQHPRDFDNSVYHGTTDGKAIYSSLDEILDPDITDKTPIEPHQLTQIHKGLPQAVGWPIDIEVGDNDKPFALYSVQVNAQDRSNLPGLDHRFYYARFNGKRWVNNEIAYAGSSLYEYEQDYTGLAALDPHDPDYAVISTNADPKTGKPLISNADGKRHWELYEGRTTDKGKTWSWQALTAHSTVDNIRPIIPTWDSDKRIILWMRGTYISYTDFNTQIVGVTRPR